MATATTAEIERQKKELCALVLKKTGVKKQTLVDMILDEFVRKNIDVLTPTELKRFNLLVLNVKKGRKGN